MSDEQAIRGVIKTWLSASAAGDTEKVLSLMTDDVVFLTPGQPPMNKAAFAVAQAGLKDLRIEATSDIKELRVCVDWAYCWSYLTVVITPRKGGPSTKRAGNVLSIFHKRLDGSWALARDANLLSVVR